MKYFSIQNNLVNIEGIDIILIHYYVETDLI